MENSTSSINKTCSSGYRSVVDDSREESSWTFYFEDFLCNKNNNIIERQHTSFSNFSGYETPSLVPDASSSVAKKFTDNDDQLNAEVSINRISCKKLRFKKRIRKAAAIVVDDALEDTASSPVNSPEKEGGTTSSAGRAVERIEHATELEKRGLCSVPVSTLANYIA